MNDTPKPSRPQRKLSRYQKAQERRDAQRRADQRFYNGIFGIIGACVLVVLGLAMIASSGNSPVLETNDSADALVRDTFLGMTALEWGGLAIVAVIGLIMWRRFRKK